MKGFLKYILLLFLFVSFQEVNAQWRLVMEMVVTDEGKKLPGAEIKVFKNGSLIESVLTDAKGRADIPMDPHGIYTIEIGGNKGMIKKKLSVNTKDVPPEAGKGDIYYPAEVEIFKSIDGMDLSILDKPIGKVVYDAEYGDFGADRQYTKQVQKDLEKLKQEFLAQKAAEAANEKQQRKVYDAAVKIADKAFAEEDWEKAELEYKKAEKALPIESYPSFQLAELETKLIKIRADNKKYDEVIKKADAATAASNYEVAIAEYKKASGYKPKEAYPKDKLKEVQSLLANAAKNEQSYLAAVEKGDNALKINDMKLAKAAYEEAIGFKPNETYPKNKIAEIDDILAKQGAKEEEYKAAIKAADEALGAKSYEAAKSSYEKALGIKPTEAYPKDQITRVEGLIAKAAKAEQDYLAAIEKGDKALTANSYEDAKAAFLEASNIKPDEEYPKTKIKEIADFLAKSAAAEKEYQDKIKEGDKALAAKDFDGAKASFEEAKGLKPAESYPQEKLKEIEGILANAAKLEQDYKAAIEKGDKEIAAKSFEDAKAAFNEALSLKPDEQYPKDKLSEIETIVLSNKKNEEKYNTAIQNGDDALANKDYAKAKEFFNEALSVKAEEQYPKDKITEIDGIVAAEAEKEKNYTDAIAAADKAMKAGSLEDAKKDYQKASSIKPEEAYPKDQLTKIDAELAANQKVEADYQAAISEGDAAFTAKEYEKAKAAFEKAQGIKASEEYPKTKITEIDGLLAEQKNKEDSYNKAIEKGDKAFAAESWEDAKIAFEEALGIMINDYPKSKITEIDAKIASIAAQKESEAKLEADYQAAITEGDKQLADKKYDDAITAFNSALALKPNEAYPTGKLAEIKVEQDKLAAEAAEQEKLAALQKQYDDLIGKADAALAKQELESARTDYQAASALKTDEEYPKSKIEEIDGILADAAEQDKNYNDAIAAADALLSDQKLEEAKAKYTEASGIKTAEQYPKDKIAEIDQKIADLAAEQEEIRLKNEKEEAINAQYQELITAADALLEDEKYEEAKAKYNEAIGVKDEQYPKDKISEIEIAVLALADKAAAEALAAEKAKIDAQYQEIITAADALLAEEKYEEAKAKYNEAIGVKDEQYPKDKISEIEIAVLALADKAAAEALAAEKAKIDAQYQEIITVADALLAEGKYDDAKAKYNEAIAVKNEQYPKDKIAEIESAILALADKEAADALAAEKDKIEAQYQELITAADALLAEEKYEDAKVKYNEAIAVKNEQYPKDKIAEIESAILALADKEAADALAAEKDKIEAQYQELITAADAFLAEEKYEDAKLKYNEAITVKNEQYPKDKIAEIESAILANADKEAAEALAAKNAKIDAEYQELITAADALFVEQKFDEAKLKYQAAIAVKEEDYPKNKIIELDLAVAKMAELAAADALAADNAKKEVQYNEMIATADALLADANYNEAKAKYTEALGVKEEQYPKDKISEIDSKLNEMANAEEEKARLAKIETNYLIAIEKGDKAFAVSDWEQALINYDNAKTLKSSEEYPSNKIAEIRSIIAKRDAENEAEIKLANENYAAAILEAENAFVSKDYENAIISYESAQKIKPSESVPPQKIKEIKDILNKIAADAESIRLRKENEAKNEAAYQTAITNGDKYFSEKNYNDAENEFRLALSLKSSETYPQEKLDEINDILAKKEAARLAAEQKKLDEANKESRYAELIEKGDAAFEAQTYQLAKKDFELASSLKPSELYPKSQLKRINDLLEKERIAEAKRLKDLDKPIEIMKGPKSTITGDAEAEIEKMYKELWAKQNSDKNAVIDEKTEIVKKMNDKHRENELARRQNAIQLIESISISVQEQSQMTSELNLQNYEVVKEIEQDQKLTNEQLERDAERRRNNNSSDNIADGEQIYDYNKVREEQLVEGKKELIQNEHDEIKISTERKIEKQAVRAKEVEEEFVQKDVEIRTFNETRAEEIHKENNEYLEEEEKNWKDVITEYRVSSDGIRDEEAERLIKDAAELKNTIEDDNKMADERIGEQQQKVNDQELEQNQFLHANNESFKNNQLTIEEQEKTLAEETKSLEAEAEIRRQEKKGEEFYEGEKKIRQDQEAAKYPQGVTEEIIENQNNSTTIRRIVVEGTQTDIYEKTLYSWGGVFYTKNKTNITKETWDKESR